MLAPDDLDPIIGALNGFHANVRAADSLSGIFKSFTVNKISREAEWVLRLRGQMLAFNITGESWKTGKVMILPNILSSFGNYYNRFKAVATYLPQADDGEVAASMLNRLLPPIKKNMEEATQAKTLFNEWVSDARRHIDFLDESISKAWKAIGSSERKVTALSEQIVQVQNELSSLDGVISLADISAGTVRNAKNLLSEMASMFYTVAVAGGTVQVLGVAMSFFTLGKMFYDIFSTSSKIENELNRLKQCQLDLKFEQVALAQTKAALMYVYSMKMQLAQQYNTLRELEAFWQNELRQVNTIRQNFALTEHYKKDNPEIVQLPIAESIWFSLKTYSEDILESFNCSLPAKTKICFALKI